MREDGRMTWIEKVDEFFIETQWLFGMILKVADKRLMLDAVEMLHRPLVWYLVGRFFRFL